MDEQDPATRLLTGGAGDTDDLMADGRCTIVVATRDRHDQLAATLPRHLALSERPRVLVVDDASAEPVVAPGADVLRLSPGAGGAARNAAPARARRPTSPSPTMTRGGAPVRCAALSTCWRPTRALRSCNRTSSSGARDATIPRVRRCGLHRSPARLASPAGRSSPLSRVPSSSAERRSWPAADSASSSAPAARSNCSAGTWPRPAGSCPTFRA